MGAAEAFICRASGCAGYPAVKEPKPEIPIIPPKVKRILKTGKLRRHKIRPGRRKR